MNQKQEKDIIRVLAQAGKQDLAQTFARSRGYRVTAVNPTGYLKTSRQMLAHAQKQFGKSDKEYVLALASAIDELSKAVYDVDRGASDRLMDAVRELSIIGSQAQARTK